MRSILVLRKLPLCPPIAIAKEGGEESEEPEVIENECMSQREERVIATPSI